MNNATKAFFKDGSGVVLAVYDTRRGQIEGRESEKMLAFYPPTATPAMQSSIVGLAQALTMFAGTFNKECPFHTMEAQGHVWTMYHAEPDLWLLLVVGRAVVGPHCLNKSLTGFLKGLHSVMVLLHGLLSTQLEQDDSGVRIRRRLQPLLQEAACSVLQPDPSGLPGPLSSPLGLTGGVPLLPISPAAFTRLQSLTNSLLVARIFGVRPVLGVLAAWQTCLLWSSLSSSDTAALHSLAVRGLEPAAREGPRHKTLRRPLTNSVAQQQQMQQQAGTGPVAQPHGSNSSSSSVHADSICLANPGCWYSRPDGLLLPIAGSSSCDSSSSSSRGGAGGDSSSAAPAAGAAAAARHVVGDAGVSLPTVWLQSGCEQAQLMAWHSGPLLILLLLEASGPTAGSSSSMACSATAVASLLELLSGPGQALAGQLAGELPAKHLWHVQGLRYLYQDHLSAAVRASPARKVSTLSQPSLHLTAEVRCWTDLEAAAAADPTAPLLGNTASAMGNSLKQLATHHSSSGSGGSAGPTSSSASGLASQWEAYAAGGTDADVEVVVRGANDCWVVGKHTAAGRQLTAVVEGDKDKGMLGFMRRIQAFCDNEVPGVFDGLS